MNEITGCCRIDINEDLIAQAKGTLSDKHDDLNQEAKLFSLLGNEVRLKIIALFLEYERMCVCDLADVLEMKQSPISQHLRKLKDGGLLDNVREGMTIFYFIAEPMKEKLERILDVR